MKKRTSTAKNLKQEGWKVDWSLPADYLVKQIEALNSQTGYCVWQPADGAAKQIKILEWNSIL